MNSQLLQWGLFSFMIGIVLSLPLSSVIYNKHSAMSNIFTNARKLKSAHLDYFTQAFAMGFACLLEIVLKKEFSMFITIPLIYGSIINPTILLLEATSFIRKGLGPIIVKLLRATGPVLLLFSWFAIAFLILPLFLKFLLLIIVVFGGGALLVYQFKAANNQVK